MSGDLIVVNKRNMSVSVTNVIELKLICMYMKGSYFFGFAAP